MQKSTKEDLQRLLLYGSMYNLQGGGLQPVEIEGILYSLREDPLFDQALRMMTTGNEADQAAARSATNTVFSTVSSITAAIPVGGAIIGAAVGIVGAIVGAIQEAAYSADCDSKSALPDNSTGHFENKQMNLRVLTSYNAPDTVNRRIYGGASSHELGRCLVKGWGSSDKKPEARWGHLAQSTNDGAWFWQKPEGTIIGVHAMWDTGALGGCWVYMANSPVSPRLNSPIDPNAPTRVKFHHAGSDSAPYVNIPEHARRVEYRQRALAILLYLKWLRSQMSYATLACMENFLHGEKGVGDEEFVCRNLGKCKDRSLISYSGVSSFSIPSSFARKRQHASRFYNSVRSMFDALVKQADIIGKDKVAAQLRLLGSAKAADALEGKTRNDATSEELRVWPEWAIAKELSWVNLKRILNWEADQVEAKAAQTRMVSEKLAIPPNMSSVKIAIPMPSVLFPPPPVVNTWKLPSTPVLLAGGAVLAFSVYWIWRMRSAEDGDQT